MKMLRKLVFCSICIFLCTSFRLGAQAPELSASLCEVAYWECADKAGRDSLLIEKAAYLASAGDFGQAYETLGRISNFGLSADGRTELLRRKMIYLYSADRMDEFCGMLDEASEYGLLDGIVLDGRPAHKSENAALILSVIPGAGLAYAGEWGDAAKYFLINGSIIALGVGAFTSGLYVSSFLGGGILLYQTMPLSTEMAVEATADYNSRALKEYYAPLFDSLVSFKK